MWPEHRTKLLTSVQSYSLLSLRIQVFHLFSLAGRATLHNYPFMQKLATIPLCKTWQIMVSVHTDW